MPSSGTIAMQVSSMFLGHAYLTDGAEEGGDFRSAKRVYNNEKKRKVHELQKKKSSLL
jgi:hypothetical protein